MIWFAGQTEIPRKFIGAAVLFLPLFVFMPNLKPHGMKADTDAVIDSFGKNEQVKEVFLTVVITMVLPVLARVVDGDNSAGGRDYFGNGGVSRIHQHLLSIRVTWNLQV